MPITLAPAERDALYCQVLVELTAFDDLRHAWEVGNLEQAYRLGRRCADALRLVVDGLGWGDHAADPVELAIPPEELRRILSRLRDSAATQHESERAEQEEFRAAWDRTALVRDTCAAKVLEISASESATDRAASA